MSPIDQVAVIIAGLVWPLIFETLGKLHLQNRAAQLAAVILSYVVAALVILATGHTWTAQALITDGSEIAVLSQLVYRQLMKPTGLTPKL